MAVPAGVAVSAGVAVLAGGRACVAVGFLEDDLRGDVSWEIRCGLQGCANQTFDVAEAFVVFAADEG